MVYLSSFKKLSRAKQLAVLLVISLLSYTIGLPTFFATASASQVTSFSATASTTNNSTLGNYHIQFTTTSSIAAASTTIIQLSYGNSGGTNEFDISTLVTGDLVLGGMTLVANVAACSAAASEVYPSFSNAAGNRSITLTVCPTDTITTGVKDVWLGNNHVTNPATTGSYKIALGGTSFNTGQTMVAILPQVTVTAAVDSTLTFTVAGVATAQSVNGTTTSTTTSATAIAYGTLNPGTIYTAAQDLTVTTNAQNGFVVTVHEDQNLLSSNGADIDTFANGTNTATPVLWTAPLATLGVENTYGHFGLTSDDADLNAGEFIANKWAGNFFSTTTRAVFSNTGPSDGTTQNSGKARVGYQIQVSALQEAATDYSNHLIYVCTPTF